MYFKDFDNWNKVKKNIEKEKPKIHIRIGEIRWASIGVNIGSEIDGKGASFTRPVLILNVIGKNLALVIPMSTKIKDIAGYHTFQWKNKDISLCIHQIKIISQKRIFTRYGHISDKRLAEVKKVVKQFHKL